MGYTHYWSFKKTKSKTIERRYAKAILECQKILVFWNENAEDFERLSGYAAHCKPGTYGGIDMNGKGENGHESFVMRKTFSENLEHEPFGFCKTARKPYDVPLTACLAVLKSRLGDVFDVSSDGRAIDWSQGVDLAKHVLKDKKIINPIATKLRSID